jgi:hypothetical protein
MHEACGWRYRVVDGAVGGVHSPDREQIVRGKESRPKADRNVGGTMNVRAKNVRATDVPSTLWKKWKKWKISKKHLLLT